MNRCVSERQKTLSLDQFTLDLALHIINEVFVSFITVVCFKRRAVCAALLCCIHHLVGSSKNLGVVTEKKIVDIKYKRNNNSKLATLLEVGL